MRRLLSHARHRRCIVMRAQVCMTLKKTLATRSGT
jgi:hypothetical protein